VIGLEIWLLHTFSVLLVRPPQPHKVLFFNEDIVHITSASVIGILICGNSQRNYSLSENIADSVFGCCVINSSTLFIE
jgi:hypothetical protein